MANDPGKSVLLFVAVGLGLIAVVPIMDAAQPCGWIDLGCKGTRFLLFWVLTLAGVGAIGVGLFGAAKTFGAAERGVGLASHAGRRGVKAARGVAARRRKR